MVKAGPGCKVLPLMVESTIVITTRHCRTLSTHLRKWLRAKNLPVEPRLLRLEEGYIQEGSCVTVIGMLHKNNDVMTIVSPPQLISTGCLWQRLLLPVDIDGLVLGVSNLTCPVINPDRRMVNPVVSRLQIDGTQTNQEEQRQRLVDERIKEIKLIAQKVSVCK
ncbi:hypothetical protein Q3G72_024320 [Acer saccharum]|nr:hypothetical protein Q3G72_024320 [Acer saccharum]